MALSASVAQKFGQSHALRFGGVVLVTVGLTAATLAVAPRNASELYVVYLAAILLITAYLGRSAGYLAAGSSAALLAYFVLEGEGFAVSNPTEALGFAAFVTVALIGSTCVAAVKGDLDKMAARNGRLEAENLFSSSLLAEISHRFQNDLSALTGIAALQESLSVQEETRSALRTMGDRLRLMSQIYSHLQFQRNSNASVEMRTFLTGLCEEMRRARLVLRPICLIVSIEPCEMAVGRAVLVGLVVNELLTNAFKYAFPDDQPGMIRVEIMADTGKAGNMVLKVTDDGVGFTQAEPKGTGLGKKLINAMAAQLDGAFSLSRHGEHTVAELRFPRG